MWPIMEEHKLTRRIPITNGNGTHHVERTPTVKDQPKRHVFRLENDIPIPAKRHSQMKTPNAWGVAGAIRRMQIGQSFFVRVDDKKKTKKLANVGAAVRTLNQRNGTSLKITTRQVDGGIRVWRIA